MERTTTPETDATPEISPTPNPKGEMLWESSPSRYIAKVSLVTGKEIPRPIDPGELLVHAHRDRNPIEVTAAFLASRLVSVTGNEDSVKAGLRKVNALGERIAGALGTALGSRFVEKRARQALGVAERSVCFRFRETSRLTEKEVSARVEKLRRDARALLRARGRSPRLEVLLTGGTGFLGKEILVQAASDRRIAKVWCVIRSESVRDPKTKEVVRTLGPAQRGALLLKRLRITGNRRRKFLFVEGDIEKPNLGLSDRDVGRLSRAVTHVVHCAASVSFDDAYENSFRANVLGARHALEFALTLQKAKGSKFINHVAIETSYIHGRKKRTIAQEGALVFPRAFYNNFYELTKAMASLETDRFLVENGLRVAQLLPAIVIGHSRTGNNYGDTKVVNAPINAFGRSKEALDALEKDAVGRGKAWLIASIAGAFPSDRSAELNLVPVDRVAEGILAADHPGGAGHQRPPRRPDALQEPDPSDRESRPREGGRAEAGERAREARHDLRRLRRVGPAAPRGRKRREDPRPSDPAAQHARRLPDALPAQQVRSGVREGARSGRDRPARALLGGRHRPARVRDGTPGRLHRGRRVPEAPRAAARLQDLPAESRSFPLTPRGVNPPPARAAGRSPRHRRPPRRRSSRGDPDRPGGRRPCPPPSREPRGAASGTSRTRRSVR
jgi:nucleoside-diphosphate-sugar epimerase